MAGVAQHLGVALRMNATYFKFAGDALKEFLLGTVVCDAPKIELQSKEDNNNIDKQLKILTTPDMTSRKSTRAYSHMLPGSINLTQKGKFIDNDITMQYGYNPVDDSPTSPVNYEQFCPMINYFISKYNNILNEPFMLGYLTHLVADKIYFSKIVPEIVTKNESNIQAYINDKYAKLGYKKSPYLTNGEYLEWSHDALYKVFADYNYLSMFELVNIIPRFTELSEYYQKWELANREFKPSMVEDLPDVESITDFLENSNIIKKLDQDLDYILHSNGVINVEGGLSFKDMWSYNLYLTFLDDVEAEVKDTIDNQKGKNRN